VGVLVGQAWGSGVIVSKDGYVLTAAHVAGAGRNRGRGEAEFVLSDGRKLKGKTLGLFRTVDAGLMKITEAGEYPFAEMGSSDALKFGQWCLAVGHPGGHQEERGTVLRLGRIEGMDDESITTDCTLVGGDSGGPLFDLHGRVIGINSRIGEQLYNNMHVPVSAYQKSWDRLVKAETWGHLPGQDPYLGVTGEEKREGEGARIATVKKDSPGEKYGLRPGDVVVRFDEKEISSFQSLVAAVADCEPNESVKLRVRRGEETVELRLRLGKKP
jgi:S1-C subfamily serine protease